jgi:hypothetical protein
MGLADASVFLVEGARGELLGPLLTLAPLADALLVVLELAFLLGIRSPGGCVGDGPTVVRGDRVLDEGRPLRCLICPIDRRS